MKTTGKIIIEPIIAGCKLDRAKYLHKHIETELENKDVINIITKNGVEIKNIKSVASWGEGFYYGKRKNQKKFTKSMSVFSIQTVNDIPLANL